MDILLGIRTQDHRMVSADGSFELLQPQKEKMMIIGTFQISVARIEATGPPTMAQKSFIPKPNTPPSLKIFFTNSLKIQLTIQSYVTQERF